MRQRSSVYLSLLTSVRVDLVSVFGGVVLGRDNQTSALPRTTVDGLHNVDQLLFILHGPVDFVVVSSSQIDHDVLVPKEEHYSTGVVQLVHLVEVRDLADIDEVDDAKVLHLFGNGVEAFVHLHTGWIPVVAKPDADNSILLRQDGLVDLPAIVQMLKHETHLGFGFLGFLVEV